MKKKAPGIIFLEHPKDEVPSLQKGDMYRDKNPFFTGVSRGYSTCMSSAPVTGDKQFELET